MPKLRKHKITVGGVETAYLSAGSGPPAVFLHDTDTFPGFKFAEAWIGANKVVVPYHPGFGESGDAAGIEDMSDYVLHYLDFLDALELDAVALIGHGFGGWMAAKLASLAPERVTRLVLAAPAGLRIPNHPGIDRFKVPPEDVPGMLMAKPAAIRKYIPKTPDVEFQVARYREASSLARIVWEWPYDKSLPKWLHRIAAPTLIVWGSDDKFFPAAQSKVWAELIPDARVARFKGAGHMPFHEDAAAVARAGKFISA